MTKEVIDDFLSENEQLKQRIKRISQNYSISDFVKATEIIRDYIQNKESENVHGIWGCLYNIRKGYLRLDIESVESRLTNEYLEYLREILMSEEDIDKVFYIVAYHYLTLAKQLGYQLTGANNHDAPFSFMGDEMSPFAETNYKKLCKIFDDRLFGIVNYFNKEDLIYYNKVYRELGYTHHATKHFSLIEYLEGFAYVLSSYEFDFEFEKALELFIFRYRAIYTEERLHLYMRREVKDKVISKLVDV